MRYHKCVIRPMFAVRRERAELLGPTQSAYFGSGIFFTVGGGGGCCAKALE